MPVSKQHRISFEFFPPKTPEGRKKLGVTREKLSALAPDFFSVTYGAGGSTRDNTRDIVFEGIDAGCDIAPHLSFGGDGETSILELLNSYKKKGIRRIVALRGDLPSGFGKSQLVYANELVAFIQEHFPDHFDLMVAAYPEVHPEAESYARDIHFLKTKLDAGASSAITQYFYNADAYKSFIDDCNKAGITKPIYPGIMPITNFANLQRFSRNCGAEIPRWLVQKLEHASDEDTLNFGIELVTELSEKLLEAGAPGFHFYTLNQAEPTIQICKNLGVTSA